MYAGKKAIIVGLRRNQELNGTHVTVIEELDNGRISVMVPRPVYDRPKPVAIQPNNLILPEECPICMETEMDMETSTEMNCGIYWCCGKRTCNQCYSKTQMGPDPTRCPMCRTDRSHDCERMQMKWIRDRAERGDSSAMGNLGVMYDSGRGNLTQDQAMARVWYERAARKGNKEAAHNLACSLRDGEGGPVDLPKALHFYKFAAERGYVKSMTNVGDAYVYGRGVAKDLDLAELWYKKGAATGQERSMMKLEEVKMIKSGSISIEYIAPLGGGRFLNNIRYSRP